jgi:hypothetical protein
MTRAELEQIAKKSGFVRWTKSGQIEYLRICVGIKKKHSAGHVLAGNIFTWRDHGVDYNCIEVLPSDLVCLGDLFDKRSIPPREKAGDK